MSTELDQYIQRMQNMRPFNVYSVDKSGNVKPWYEVTANIVSELVIQPYDMALQVQTISNQIQFWGQMESQCKRVWQIEERNYRTWRDAKYLEFVRVPDDPDEAAAWKKPSDKIATAQYRQLPEYHKKWEAVERAEEAFNASHNILEGFRAKKDMLKSYVYRSHEDGAVKLSV